MPSKATTSRLHSRYYARKDVLCLPFAYTYNPFSEKLCSHLNFFFLRGKWRRLAQNKKQTWQRGLNGKVQTVDFESPAHL